MQRALFCYRYIFIFLIFGTPAFSFADATKQKTLEDLVCSTKWDYLEQQNDIQRARSVAERDRGIRDVLQGRYSFTNWEGVIRDIDVVGESGIALTVSLKCKIRIKTWNNSISDIGDGTIIDIQSPIGDFLANAYVGDKVKVSGTFIPGISSHIYESSITERGRMTEPEYIVHFRKVTK